MIEGFVKKINPDFNKFDELYFLLSLFSEYTETGEPPSSGAFACAASSNDLVGGVIAFLACCGEKHLCFDKALKDIRKLHPWYVSEVDKGRPVSGFGHPKMDSDYRVEAFFKRLNLASPYLINAKIYHEKGISPCLNYAGLFACFCLDYNLDERACILPLLSRILGLSAYYKSGTTLPESKHVIETFYNR